MRYAGTLSIAFHTAIILFAWLGAPSFRPLIAPEQLIQVELVAETDKSKPEPKQEPKPKPKPAVKPPPPPPPKVSKPEPEAVPLPKPKPKLAEKPKPKPKPKPKIKPKPKPEPTRQIRRPRPKSKPKPPQKKNDFASVLKTVSKLKSSPPVKKAEPEAKKTKPAQDFQKQVAAALKRAHTPSPRLNSVISASELDAIRRQIEACWNLPAGARDARDMTVEIRTLMNPDGRVRSASIVDTGRADRDHFYRSMAESALRAVLNPKCQPLRLPLDKYDEWRVMVLNFDPREMF